MALTARLLQVEYEYVDSAGQARKCNFSSFSVNQEEPSGVIIPRYYFALDNRPLLTLQNWYNDARLMGTCEYKRKQASVQPMHGHVQVQV